MAQTPFTFPAQYAQFRKVRAEQERSKENTDDYASARHVGAYRDNMSILHMALVNAGGEEWAKHFTDNIEDVYDVGYHEANIDNAIWTDTLSTSQESSAHSRLLASLCRAAGYCGIGSRNVPFG